MAVLIVPDDFWLRFFLRFPLLRLFAGLTLRPVFQRLEPPPRASGLGEGGGRRGVVGFAYTHSQHHLRSATGAAV